MGLKISKILIVDDLPAFRSIIRTHLKNFGYKNIIEAEDVDSALKIIKYEKFDLIFSDLNMPGLDGVDFFKILQSDSATQNIPFILITSEARNERIEKLLKSGIKDYLILYMDQIWLEDWLKEKVDALEMELDRLKG